MRLGQEDARVADSPRSAVRAWSRHGVALLRQSIRSHRVQLLVLAPVIALALWTSVWSMVSTRHNMLSWADSAVYLGTADEIRHWHGPTVPSTFAWDTYQPGVALAFDGHVPSSHYPPGYPSALAAVSTVSGGERSAARWIDVVCVGVNVLLLGVLTARLTAYRSALVAALPAVLVVFFSDSTIVFGWLQLHIAIASEPLFILLTNGALLAACTAVGPPSPRTRRATALATAFAAGAFLTRYAGAAVVLTVALVVGVLVGGSMVHRARRAVMVGFAAVVPTALYLLWSAALGGQETRTLAYHPTHASEIVDSFGRFLLPPSWPTGARALGVVVVAIVVAVTCFRVPRRVREFWTEDRVRVQQLIAIVFIVVYVATVFATQTWLDRSTAFDARLFAPVRGVVYAVTVAVGYRLLAPYVRAKAAAMVVGLLCAALVFTGWSTARTVIDTGAGAAPVRTAAEEAIAGLRDDAIIVTNVPDIVYLASGRRSFVLPSPLVYSTGKQNHAYEAELSRWAHQLTTRRSYAFFETIPFLTVNSATATDLRRYLPLRLVVQSGDQSLYEIVRPG
jgi:hypothetical protein